MKSLRLATILNLILIASLTLTACGKARPLAVTRVEAAAPAAAAGQSQPTRLPTPQPPPLPPVITGISPAIGEEIPLDGVLTVTFDQVMDPVSTKAAFTLSPESPGEVSVTDRELTFKPAQPFGRAADYTITIGASAKSAAGLALAAPVSQSFRTVGFVEVGSTQPADGATDVAVDSPITVSFSRPMVPLTGAGAQANLPQPLEFVPPVKGAGEWLGTSIYRFVPSDGLAASTAYVATIPAGLKDVTGALLDQDYTLRFRTTDPTVVRWQPENNINVPVQSAISVTFSIPMDRVSTEDAFKLSNDAGVSIPGNFAWDTDSTTLSFKPTRNLDFGQRYTAEVGDSALAANQQGALRKTGSNRFGFLTVSLPAVTRTDPRNGDRRADPSGGVAFYFPSPMDPASFVTGTVTILPKPARVFTGYNSYDNTLWVDFNKLPATDYEVTLSGKVADPYGNTLGKDQIIKFRTRDYDPILEINTQAQIGTYNAYTSTESVVTYRNVPELRFSLARTRLDDFVEMTGPNWWEAWDRYAPHKDDLIRTWSEKTPAKPNRVGVLHTPLTDREGKQLAPGLYYLELSGGDSNLDRASTRRLLARTDLNVVLKSATDEALAWVTDLKSGQPAPGVKVRFYGNNKIDATAVTDADGVARLTDIGPRQPWETLLAIASSSGGSFGIASSEWQNGISPWDFGLQGGTSLPYNAYVYTDRPIYRPGQDVNWKVIVRRDDDVQYSIPAPGQPISVTISDERGNTVLDQQLKLGPQGTVDGKLALAADATLGYYYLSARLDTDISYGVGFQVAEYRKPEYELSARTDKPEYIQGEQIAVTTQASYFFGGPVKDAPVKWVLLSDTQDFSPPGMEGYSFSDWEWWTAGNARPFGGEISRGEGRTDSAGRFTFSVPADISKFAGSQRFTFDITVTDANNQPVSTQATAVVHKGEFYVGLKPEEYVAEAGVPQKMNVMAVDTKGRPVSDTKVTLVVNQVEWRSVREQAEDGRFYWVTRPKKTAVMTDTVTTGFNGKAVFDWTPSAAGEYKIEADARDRAGHAIGSAAWVWSSGSGFVAWRQENNDRMQLIADRNSYETGDTAKALVANPYRGPVKALVTLERDGILSEKVVELEGSSPILEIPISAEHAPNVYLSVVLVKGMDATNPSPSFRVGLTNLAVSAAERELQVRVTPRTDAQTVTGVPLAGPRATLTYDIETLRKDGTPVSADLSLALVDKAVLTLADDRAGTLMDRFYSERPLGVQTSSTLIVNVDRIVAQLPEGGKGGGGGGDESAPGANQIRRELLDLAYWNASVTTDADGKAQVEVTLPDNLTTWTMDARAATAETLVGQSKSDLIATKDLLLRPTLPRFFVDGDRAEIGAIVQNTTSRDLTVNLALTADGLDVGQAPETALVPANGSYKATWPVVVDTTAEAVTIRLSAQATTGRLSDAVEVTLPVHRYAVPEVMATSGEVDADDTRLEMLVFPPNADPTRGGMTLVIEPSLAAGLRGGLSYLEHYPYECVEQTMSRFLPNVVTYSALSKLEIQQPGLEERLRQQVTIGLQRIYANQHIDGGWGWWRTDLSNLTVSAYVVFGLAQARQAGFPVDAAVFDRGVQYLQRNLTSPTKLSPTQANEQAFMLYALAEAGFPEPNRAGALYEQREKLSHYAKAYLALALGAINDEAAPARIRTLLDELSGEAITSATTAHWEEAWTDYRGMNTDTRTTAIVLKSLATLDPANALAPNAVRWLMGVRTADHWGNTQENAWAIMALTEWMRQTGELEGKYHWSARLNRAPFGEGNVTPETVGETTTLEASVGDLLLDRANALEIERGEGPGRLYYSAYLRSYLPAEEIAPLSRGATVNRQYRLADCGKPDPEECPVVSSARVGDVLNVTVDIVAPATLHYVLLEDPLPAGLEAVNTSLKTTSITAQGPEVDKVAEKGTPSWWWSPTAIEMRDELTALFATQLNPGSYRFTYQARATLPGEFLTLPPTAHQMYFPEVWGRGAGSVFTITE